jgi:hypothetical protein
VCGVRGSERGIEGGADKDKISGVRKEEEGEGGGVEGLKERNRGDS